MGVHFAPIERWQGPYFGLFWSRIKRDYPRVEIQPPIVTAPTPEMAVAQFQSRFEVPLRCLVFYRNETRLIPVPRKLFFPKWGKIWPTPQILPQCQPPPMF